MIFLTYDVSKLDFVETLKERERDALNELLKEDFVQDAAASFAQAGIIPTDEMALVAARPPVPFTDWRPSRRLALFMLNALQRLAFYPLLIAAPVFLFGPEEICPPVLSFMNLCFFGLVFSSSLRRRYLKKTKRAAFLIGALAKKAAKVPKP